MNDWAVEPNFKKFAPEKWPPSRVLRGRSLRRRRKRKKSLSNLVQRGKKKQQEALLRLERGKVEKELQAEIPIQAEGKGEFLRACVGTSQLLYSAETYRPAYENTFP